MPDPQIPPAAVTAPTPATITTSSTNPPPNPPSPPTGQEDAAKRLERIERELEDARKEAARYRTRNDQETATFRNGLAQALGLESEQGKPPDPAKVLEEFQKRDQARERELAGLRLTNALEQTARQHGADVDILAPYLRGSGRLDKLDPAAPEFAGQLDTLVKELVDRQPKFKANGNGGQAPPRGGSEFPGGNQGPRLLNPANGDLEGMSPEQINKARKEGRIAGIAAG